MVRKTDQVWFWIARGLKKKFELTWILLLVLSRARIILATTSFFEWSFVIRVRKVNDYDWKHVLFIIADETYVAYGNDRSIFSLRTWIYASQICDMYLWSGFLCFRWHADHVINVINMQYYASVPSEDQSKTTNRQGRTSVEKGKILFFVLSFSLKILHVRW